MISAHAMKSMKIFSSSAVKRLSGVFWIPNPNVSCFQFVVSSNYNYIFNIELIVIKESFRLDLAVIERDPTFKHFFFVTVLQMSKNVQNKSKLLVKQRNCPRWLVYVRQRKVVCVKQAHTCLQRILFRWACILDSIIMIIIISDILSLSLTFGYKKPEPLPEKRKKIAALLEKVRIIIYICVRWGGGDKKHDRKLVRKYWNVEKRRCMVLPVYVINWLLPIFSVFIYDVIDGWIPQ